MEQGLIRRGQKRPFLLQFGFALGTIPAAERISINTSEKARRLRDFFLCASAYYIFSPRAAFPPTFTPGRISALPASAKIM
jgi:hypothetical protein